MNARSKTLRSIGDFVSLDCLRLPTFTGVLSIHWFVDGSFGDVCDGRQR